MIQATADRLDGLVSPDRILVVTGDQYAQLAKQQLPFLSQRQLILEPAGRNTAPAIGLAAFRTRRMNPDAIIAVMPSDHVIPNHTAYRTALGCAVEVAQDGYIVTLGIQPTSPHTGYGYIERGQVLSSVSSSCLLHIYSVVQFLEKPNQETAESFVAGDAQ
jgi:mannose-1-phosphate guanylyltransferase